MFRDHFRIGPAFVLGLVLMIGGCGDPEDTDAPAVPARGWSTPGCALARVPEHVTVGGVTMPSTPPALEAVMARIDKAGRAEYADSFAGLEVDQGEVRAIVYRVPAPAFDDFLRTTAENTCVVVRDAPYSANDLAAWHDKVLADLQFWTHREIRIVSIGARHDGTGVEIATQDLQRARLELPARYGARAPLVFVESAPAHTIPGA
jgi:hypothetical protein